MRFDSRGNCVGVASIVLALCAGCGGSDVLPVGGPFGGTLDPAAVADGGIVGAGDGVLDAGNSATVSSSTGSNAIPTWTQLYTDYFVGGTVGRCTNCHPVDMATAAS
jgi:hypothetical protein